MSRDDNFIKLQSPQVLVVEASAGSGKTYTLAKRYLQLIFSPEHMPDKMPLRSILAITFTNKAMIEMKERIITYLKKMALGLCVPGSEDDFISLLDLDGQKAAKTAELVMDNIIKHYSFFQIQTIDSFINTLLLGCSLNIDRSA
ncbi:MAG: UvrD-helicase domain-containing protein, partial [Candidatus Omnitrophica bacterium]|nr:UvrD-helicase domain-containing protein [Candidatus Omnitrophota bacterium]